LRGNRSHQQRTLWTYHRTAGKRYLKQALQQAIYVKALHLDLAIKLGYFPQVIVSYRPFGEHALSFSQLLVALFIRLMPASIKLQHRADAVERHGRRLVLNR
jgi:hypothetical protein